MIKSSIVLFLLLLLFGCSNQQTNDFPVTETGILKRFENASDFLSSWPKENIITCQVNSEPDNLHPTNGNSSPRLEIFQYIHRTILYIDFANQQIIPGLVKSLPEISPDHLTYTYYLRDSIFWDDEKKLTSADIAFTAKVYKCPLTNAPQVRSYWNNVKDIILYSNDPMKFSIVMKKTNIQNISFLTAFPVLEEIFFDNKHVLSKYSFQQFEDSLFQAASFADLKSWTSEYNNDRYGRIPELINGLGMYKVEKWENGQYIVLKKKSSHWSRHSKDYHEASFPEKIIFKLNKDETSQSLQFLTQAVDASTNVSVNNFIDLNANQVFKENYNSAMIATYNYTYLCFNEKPDEKKRTGFFDDIRVRKALACLTPVEEIIKLQYKQYGSQSKRMVSQVSPLKKEFNKSLKPVPFDIQKAVDFLNRAGWTDSDDDGILDKKINEKIIPLSIELNYIASSAEWKDIALFIKETMAKAGVQINPVGLDFKLFLEKAKSHDFDMMLGSWGISGFDEDFTQLWHTSSWKNHGSNYSGFGNAFTDALIDSLTLVTDDSVRNRLSHLLQKNIYDDQPYVFLYSSLRRNVIHKRFGNQMIFSEKPGVLYNMLKLLSITKGITMVDEATP